MKCQVTGIKRLWAHFLVYSFAVFLMYSAYGSLLSLQSSLNIVESLGTKTAAVIYGVAVFSSVFLLPLLLRTVGPRKCVISSGLCYLLQTAANFYPAIYTLIPAAIIVGIGDTILWTCMPIYVAHFAKEHKKLRGTVNEQISKFSGYFFAIFQSAKLVGNMVSYSVLQSFRESAETTNITSTVIKNVTHCGANDCQDPSLIQDNIESYVPSKAATYVLLGAMLFMQLVGISLFVAFLPSTNVNSDSPDSHTENQSESSKTTNLAVFVMRTLKDTVRMFVTLKHVLLVPGIFYAGFDYGFITSEFTRAYTSCVFGVSWVPVHAAAYGISASAVSWLGGKLSGHIPILSIFLFAGLVDSATYIFYLLWVPDNTTQWAVIPAYIFSGGMQGIWISQSQAVQSNIFSKSMDVAAPLWNFWFMLGISLQFAISPLACVYIKIVVHLAVLGVGYLC